MNADWRFHGKDARFWIPALGLLKLRKGGNFGRIAVMLTIAF